MKMVIWGISNLVQFGLGSGAGPFACQWQAETPAPLSRPVDQREVPQLLVCDGLQHPTACAALCTSICGLRIAHAFANATTGGGPAAGANLPPAQYQTWQAPQ